jgi:hypothetical protein
LLSLSATNKKTLADFNFLPVIAALVVSPDPPLRRHALAALLLFADAPSVRSRILAVLPPPHLLDLLQRADLSSTPPLWRVVAHCMSEDKALSEFVHGGVLELLRDALARNSGAARVNKLELARALARVVAAAAASLLGRRGVVARDILPRILRFVRSVGPIKGDEAAEVARGGGFHIFC